MKMQAKPFVKWAGGKGQLLPQLSDNLPQILSEQQFTYIEPFVGGGAMLFHMLQTFPNIRKVVINDINPHLTTAYSVIRNMPTELISRLRELEHTYLELEDEEDKKAFYLSVRTIFNEEEMDAIVKELEEANYYVEDIKVGERSKKAPLPFTTSTLQQEASKQLNFSTQKTMRIAQQLYEGVDIAGHGTIGVITYLRTDSVRIADEAEVAAKEYIGSVYGEEYLVKTERSTKKSEKKIQDAHEAIRPTDITLTPQLVKDSLSRDQYRLYQLIWKRFVASRMAGAVYSTTNVKFKTGDYIFTF